MSHVSTVIDVNADLGESYGRWTLGDDEAMLQQVSSANVACGFHAGDPAGIRHTVRLVRDAGATLGAHPAYPDLRGFGRRPMSLAPTELEADLIYQLGALEALARAEGMRTAYVKPHGALYAGMSRDGALARVVLGAVRAFDPGLAVLVAAGSAAEEAASLLGLRWVREAFADRAYRPDGALVPRHEHGAVVTDAGEVAARAVRLAREGTVLATDGRELELRPGSLCLHGDTPAAAVLARTVRDALVEAGVRIAPFAPRP